MEKGRLNKGFDIVGDIAIVKFDGVLNKAEKIKAVKELLDKNRNIKRVFEKTGMIEGEERIPKLKELIGKGSIALYKENGSAFYVDVKKVFFSPRMSNERLRIINSIKKNENVLDMFCGVGPFAIPVAKKCMNLVAIDINKKAIDLLKKNIEMNKVKNIRYYCGDSKKIAKKLDEKFDRVIMNFPLYAYKFLDVAIEKCKDKAVIHLYAFVKDEDPSKIKKHIKTTCASAFKNIKIEEHNAGEVAPFLARKCFDIKLKK